MRKTIKLFLKFHFTSLSPDAQPISLAVVSESLLNASELNSAEGVDMVEALGSVMMSGSTGLDQKRINEIEDKMLESKSFYAEFSDFDINRCDDWVKENVISKLSWSKHGEGSSNYKYGSDNSTNANRNIIGDTNFIKSGLSEWLSQFKDFDIQFIVDCSYLSSMWIVELLDKRNSNPGVALIPESVIPNGVTGKDFIKELRKTHGNVILRDANNEDKIEWVKGYKTGLPILPSNISPITEDLNQIIAREKGISIREAFEMNREELAFGHHSEGLYKRLKNLDSNTANELTSNPIDGNKLNALWDAKVIKTIYNKLK